MLEWPVWNILPTKAFKNLKHIANRKDEVIVLDNDEAVYLTILNNLLI